MSRALSLFICLLFAACNTTDNKRPKVSRSTKNTTDTSILDANNLFKDAAEQKRYDSLVLANIDTTTLTGKRKWIFNQFLTENRITRPEYDSLFDLNYDNQKDYIIGYYGQSGTGVKNRVQVYLFDIGCNCYIFDEEISRLPNPTFYVKQQKITWFYLGNGGGNGGQLQWLNKRWSSTKEFDVDFEGDSTKWKIIFPLKNTQETIIRPYKMIPPADILETDIK